MLAGCTDRLPSAVQPEQMESVQAKVAATPAELAYAIDGIDNARKRIILPLADRNAARALEGALAAFQTALGSAGARGIPALIEVARAAVDRCARAGLDEADLDAIRLALDHAANVAGS